MLVPLSVLINIFTDYLHATINTLLMAVIQW